MLVKIPGLAEEVEADIGNSNILFQNRAMCTPLTVSLRKDECRIGEEKNVL